MLIFPFYRNYNSLIQTQARDLSHLRQRMREGQRVCHVLTQNLGDTTKVQPGRQSQSSYSSKQTIVSHVCTFLTSYRPLKRCYVPMISITTWVRASESSWHRTLPWHKEWSPRSVDVRNILCFNAHVAIFNITSCSSSSTRLMFQSHR